MQMLPHLHPDNPKASQLQPLLENTADFQVAADLFKQLSDCSRVRIFWLLCHCEECVVNLSALVHMSPPAVSHHLRQLKASGLIVSHRVGKEVHYRAADTPQSQLLHQMIELTIEISCPK